MSYLVEISFGPATLRRSTQPAIDNGEDEAIELVEAALKLGADSIVVELPQVALDRAASFERTVGDH